MTQKRRSLVLTDETARHPFLASLPPHVRRGGAIVRPAKSWPHWRDVFATYCAGLVAALVFIV